MIVKELDPHSSTDPFARAGRRAEEQLAHYLRRAFGDRENLWIYNGLRLELGDDAAQIDHLVVHPHGMIIVESKSVTTKVKINEHGEWLRLFNGHYRGMASPVEQAKRQGEFLRQYLQNQREALRGKYLFGLQQGGFMGMPLDVRVAISDDGIIDRPKRPALVEVVKAERIVDEIEALLKEYRRQNSLLNFNANEGGYVFRKDELERITLFLLQHHRPVRSASAAPEATSKPELQIAVPVQVAIAPLAPVAEPLPVAASSPAPAPISAPGVQAVPAVTGAPPAVAGAHAPVHNGTAVAGAFTAESAPAAPPAVAVPAAVAAPPAAVTAPDAAAPPAEAAAPASGARCRTCGSERLAATWGKYGYYFKCTACGGNTPIRTDCSGCGAREKIRKDGLHFHAECAPCGTTRLYHVNAG